MRRLSIIVLAFSAILSLAACSGVGSAGGSGNNETSMNGSQASENTGAAKPGSTTKSVNKTNPAGKRLPKAEAVLKGKIIQINDKSLLLAGTGASDLFTVSSALAVYDIDKKPADSSALKAGQNVEIGYSGAIMESYPAQPASPVYIRITGQGDDLVGFYQTVLNDLWNVDKGLNSDISVLAFDLSKVTNLDDAEKSALVYVMGGSYGLQGIKGTFDELSERGYIDKDKLYFKNGILFKLEVSDVTDDSFTFKAEKWRSGLGAYYFIDCKAVRSDASWSYTVGSQAIS